MKSIFSHELSAGNFMRNYTLLVSIGLLSMFGGLQAAETIPDPGKEAVTGEQFCWVFAYSADNNLDAYEAYKDEKYLEDAVKFYDAAIARVIKDPDGFPGTIGPEDVDVAGGSNLWSDSVVGDALLCRPLLRFALIVNEDPKLKARWGAKAQSYIDLAIKMCWEKWNHRGCYYEDAAGYGSYHTYPSAINESDLSKWVPSPQHVISDNLNKHYTMSIVLVRLWRLTGNPEYKKRVVAICSRAKAMWRYYPAEDRVVWNYWMPHGPYDMEGSAPASWVAVHPHRPGYQAGEVKDWLEIYDSGLVFERLDFERIIRTNLWMAGGDPRQSAVAWKSADGTSTAGTLWDALARFDDKIRGALEDKLVKDKDALGLAYFKNVIEKHMGWNRIYVRDESKVELSKPALQPGETLTMALVIPNTVEIANGDRVKLATQTRAAGKLVEELMSQDGAEVLGKLGTVDVPAASTYNLTLWDGTNPKTGLKEPGNYLVRWTLNKEVRTWPVSVKEGEVRKKETTAALNQGETLQFDFEQALDPKRCILETATISEEQAHGGKKSLKLVNGQKARILFGDQTDLPILIAMWVYDGGETFGKETVNGGAWGVQTAIGDKFVIRKCWRSYLDGDTRYAWVNSGENLFFELHPTQAQREKGWSHWIFDFTNSQKPLISCNGKELGTLEPLKFVPSTGGVAAFFLGGDGKAGPIYIDDVRVEYPKP